jgi:hypothetical protein
MVAAGHEGPDLRSCTSRNPRKWESVPLDEIGRFLPGGTEGFPLKNGRSEGGWVTLRGAFWEASRQRWVKRESEGGYGGNKPAASRA